MNKLENELDAKVEQEEFKWYVLGLAKNREALLARSLRAIAEVYSDFIGEIYLPTQVMTSWKNNKQVRKEIPSKPGYLFVKAVEGYLDYKETKLKIGTNYRVVGDITQQEIDDMKQESIDIGEINEFEIKVGSKVVVKKGIFIGIPGTVHKIGQNGSVTVRVWLMNGSEPTDIDVHTSDVGPVEINKEEM